DQKAILSACPFTHADARLILVRQALPEEIAATGDLQGVIGFDGKELSNALTNALASREIVQIGARIAGLLFDPCARARRVLVFEPAIGVGDRDTVENLRHWFRSRVGRRCR